MGKYYAFKGAPNSNCKTREVGGNVNLLSLNFNVFLALSSQLPVFLKVAYHECPFTFTVMSVMS